MTEVSFHFNAPDRFEYASRLLRKALRKGSRVAVVAPPPTLERLDKALWRFEETEFIPHLLVRDAAQVAPRLRDTPVWLVEQPADAPHRDVLVNLGAELPHGFESFLRVVEIVSRDEEERLAARARWKHYQSRGYELLRHEVPA